jgi:hypothetical protein
MEDRFTLHDGPGVVYEFLYADPYLPGVSYQNMDLWRYRFGSLWARSDWSVDACWVHIAKSGHEAKNCPPDVFSKSQSLGNLVLLPSSDQCQDIPQKQPGSAIVITGLPPSHALTYIEGKDKKAYQADAAGLWEVPLGRPGKLCVNR